MNLFPERAAFDAAYAAGRAQVVWTRHNADLETPVSAFYKLNSGAAPACLLESVIGGSVRNRYSFIGLEPDLIWRARDGKAETKGPGNDAFTPCKGAILESLRALIAESHIALPEELPPMAAGLIGYLGYDLVREMEALPPPGPDPLDTEDAVLIRPTVMIVFDAVHDEMLVITPVRPAEGVAADAAWQEAQKRLEDTIARLREPLPAEAFAEAGPPRDVAIESNVSKDDFCAMVEQAREYIAAGDIFQVVLSQRFSAQLDASAFSFYRQLRRLNPSPFLYFLDFGDLAVAGSSPEILVRVRDGEVTIRPIAGTRPRGANEAEDAAYAESLLADEKELAEHLMLLDLGRNDVGRVARPGSVKVTEQNQIELYSHVMHIVSHVVGELAEDKDALDALVAGFPAGTVSGAPKIRAMEIINELEPDKRGIYSGAVGYFSADGAMDSCIALRTAVIKDGRIYVQAGAGIVWDSDPDSEYEECRRKAEALFVAVRACS